MAAEFLEYSPKRRMIFDKFFGKEGEEKCLNSILEHHFNFSVGVLAPSFSKQKLYESISSVFTEFSCLAEVTLTEILDTEFILKFVKPGSVCGLSHGTKIDTSDCAALLPTGILHLSLTKDTYECLGIQGKPSPFKNSLRFDIEINLLAQYFKPSKKFYERALRGFLKTGLKFKFLFSAISKSDDDEPSRQKLEAYFKSHGIIYEAFTNKQELQEFSELDIPVISYNNEPFLEVDSECNGIAFHEWLGCVVCGVDCSESASDSFVSTLSCPRPHHPGKAAFWKWTGFLHSDAVCEVIKLAREVLNKNPQVPWLSIMIWGFSDSPISWRDHRHGYFLSGLWEIMMNNHEYIQGIWGCSLWIKGGTWELCSYLALEWCMLVGVLFCALSLMCTTRGATYEDPCTRFSGD
ncbi:Hypothetical predicted protein [Paramuricea clavata]|uniref:Uncharacterized protein n=1 Tax=Paramuricea clavata TaxID=317549 RepID=A0A7D9HH03_PARCT|nr:Hypothetical predicted protein [Paramuricea clavata]